MLKMGQPISVRQAALVGGVVRADEVVLADRAVDLQGVVGHVGGQRAVGAVRVGIGAGVDDDGQLGGRDDERGDPAQAPDFGRGGDEDRRFPPLVGEQLVGVDARRRASGGDALGGQGGVQLSERPLVPGKQILDIDDRR